MSRGKSRRGPGPLFTIREASKLTGVPAHTIRFWEKDFGMFLRPLRTPGGQRRYRSKDIELIGRIKHFRYTEQYTVAGTVNELKIGKQALRGAERMVDEIAEMIRVRVLRGIAKGT